jgi:cytochrome c553
VQTHDLFTVVDWHPDKHPTMPLPPIVAHGRKPAVIACGYCHLPDGSGRPENAMLAGLPEPYFIQQVADMRSRARRSASPVPWRPSEGMRAIADSATDAEVAEAARYFSRIRGRMRSRVIESDSVPRTVPYVGLYVPAPGGGMELLGRRLIEMTTDLERHELRDAENDYVAYVPRGSIERGRSIARGGVGGTQGCMKCHGLRMRGGDAAPPLAGRSPSYILRQLLAFKTGTRASPAAAPMRQVAEALTLDDMIAAAAYAGSRPP